MAGQGSSRHHQRTGVGEPVYNVRVSYPINDNSSKEIRDNILIDFFGYTELDIKALDEQKKGYFYINDKRHPDRWAKGAEVKSWAFNADGTVRIDMPQKLIDSLNEFQRQRASLEIFKVGMFITDVETRRQIAESLEEILSASGEKRITALNDLMTTIAGAPAKGEIFHALRFLSNESGYKNNPFLLIAMARTSVYESGAPPNGSNEVNQSSIASAVEAANASLYSSSSKSELTRISKAEAAAINYWAGELYGQSNAEDKANQREWVRRFLAMSDKERATFKAGDIIESIPNGATAMGTPSPLEKDLDNLEVEQAQVRESWRQNDEGRQIVERTDPRAANRTGTQFDEKFNVKEQVWDRKDGNKPSQQSRPSTYTYQVNMSQQLGQGSTGTINHISNASGLVLEYFKWQTFHQRMAELTKYLAKKETLVRQIRAEKTHIVPPRPEVVKAYIKDFLYYGRITVNPFEKRVIVSRLDDLQVLLEESNAFYR